MPTIEDKLDKIIQLTPEERLIIFGPPKPKHTRFVPKVEEPVRENHLSTSFLVTGTIVSVLKDALRQIRFCLIRFPEHVKPPPHFFDNTLEAFLKRRADDQSAYELYRKTNSQTLNVAKLNVEYEKCIPILNHLINDLAKTRSYLILRDSIVQMQKLDTFLINLDKGNQDNIKLLRQREIQLINLCRIKTQPSKQILKLDREYVQVQNEYHDARVVKARQLRYNKNLIAAQISQITKREKNKIDAMINEINKLSQMSENELTVFQESSRFNYLSIHECKIKVEEWNEKYENDLIQTEFEIARVQSQLNYFEEMWEEKCMHLDYMKLECDKYVESVCQRKREVIAKRLGKLWIESARKTIAVQKRKAKILAKKNKEKNKMKIVFKN